MESLYFLAEAHVGCNPFHSGPWQRPPIGLRDCVTGLIFRRDCVKTILFLRDCVNRLACVMRENVEKLCVIS